LWIVQISIRDWVRIVRPIGRREATQARGVVAGAEVVKVRLEVVVLAGEVEGRLFTAEAEAVVKPIAEGQAGDVLVGRILGGVRVWEVAVALGAKPVGVSKNKSAGSCLATPDGGGAAARGR
jgi:hypothetical protein